MKSIYKNLGANYSQSIFLLLNRACNLACPYCYCKDSLLDQAVPSLKQIKQALRFINSIPKVEHITLIGGEPLLNKKQVLYVFEGIKKINRQRKHKIMLSIITNGTFYINLRKYKAMLHSIQISLNGYREEHNKYRRFKQTNKGSFDTIISNFYKYRQDGIQLKFHCVVDHITIDNIIPSLEKLIQKVDFIGVPFNLQISHFDDWSRYAYKFFPLQFKLLKLSRRYPGYDIHPHYLSHNGRSNICAAGSSFYGVDIVSGKINACHERGGTEEGLMGNIIDGLDIEVVNNNFKECALKLYQFPGLPRWFSYWLFYLFPMSICPNHNKENSQNKFVVAWYLLIWSMLSFCFTLLTKKKVLTK